MLVYEQILRLEVTVEDTMRVAVKEACCQLVGEFLHKARLVLFIMTQAKIRCRWTTASTVRTRSCVLGRKVT